MSFISNAIGSNPQAEYQNIVKPAQLDHTSYGGAIGQGMADQGQARGQQMDFITALQQQAAGNGPSVAQNMLRQSTDAGNQQAQSLMASQRGINPALAMRGVMDAQAHNNQQMAGQAATMRAQEQLGAQGLLGSALHGMRGQDLTGMSAAGQLQNAQNTGTTQNTLGAAGLNTQLATGAAQANGQIAGGIVSGIGSAAQAGLMAGGGVVPGRANAPGDAASNDTVPAQLSPGEVVLPRSVSQAEDAPEKAAVFVRAIQRKRAGGGGPQGYGKVLELHRRLGQELAMACGGMVRG